MNNKYYLTKQILEEGKISDTIKTLWVKVPGPYKPKILKGLTEIEDTVKLRTSVKIDIVRATRKGDSSTIRALKQRVAHLTVGLDKQINNLNGIVKKRNMVKGGIAVLSLTTIAALIAIYKKRGKRKAKRDMK